MKTQRKKKKHTIKRKKHNKNNNRAEGRRKTEVFGLPPTLRTDPRDPED
jgi:hypothetical protein